jgi:hypothetical protein
MKKLVIVSFIIALLSIGMLSGCVDNGTNSNEYSGDFAKVHEASDNAIKTKLLNEGYEYQAIEDMTFGDRDVLIVNANNWKVTGEFFIAGATHSYSSDVQEINGQYTAITTIT